MVASCQSNFYAPFAKFIFDHFAGQHHNLILSSPTVSILPPRPDMQFFGRLKTLDFGTTFMNSCASFAIRIAVIELCGCNLFNCLDTNTDWPDYALPNFGSRSSSSRAGQIKQLVSTDVISCFPDIYIKPDGKYVLGLFSSTDRSCSSHWH